MGMAKIGKTEVIIEHEEYLDYYDEVKIPYNRRDRRQRDRELVKIRKLTLQIMEGEWLINQRYFNYNVNHLNNQNEFVHINFDKIKKFIKDYGRI